MDPNTTAAPEVTESPTDAPTVEITPEGPDETVDLTQPEPTPRDEQGRFSKHGERKAQRAADHQAVESVRQEFETKLEAERRLWEQRMEDLRQQTRPPEQPKPDQGAEKLKTITKQMQRQLQIAGADGVGADLANEAMERYYELDAERIRLLTAPQQAAPPPNASATILIAEYPWLETDQSARDMAVTQYRYLTQFGDASGKIMPPGLATERLACQMVAQRRGIGGKAAPPPSPARQAAYQGVAARTGGGQSAGKVTFTAEEWSFIKEAKLSDAQIRKIAKEIADEDPSRIHR